MAAREVHKASSIGTSSTTLDTFQDKLTLSFTPPASGAYLVLWSGEAINTNNAGVLARTRLYDVTAAEAFSESAIYPKDVTNWYSVFGGTVKSLTGGVAQSWKVQYCTGTASTPAQIRNVRVLAIRLGADDHASFERFEVDTTSTSYADMASLSLSPAAGDYLVGIIAHVWNDGDTYRSGVQGVTAAGAFGEIYGILSLFGDAEEFPVALLTRATLSAGSQTIKLQAKVQNAAQMMQTESALIFALSLAGFDDWGYDESVAEQGGVIGTSYTTVESLTHPMFEGDYVGFYGASMRNMWNSHDHYIEARAGGTAFGVTQVEGRDNTSPYSRHSNFGLWFGDDQVAGFKTFDIRHKHEHASGTSYTAVAKIAVLGVDVITAMPVDVTGAADILPMGEVGGTITNGVGTIVQDGGADVIGLIETGGGVIAGKGLLVAGAAEPLELVETGATVTAGSGALIDGPADTIHVVETGGVVISQFPGITKGPADVLELLETGGVVAAGLGVVKAGPADALALVEAGGTVSAGIGVIAMAAADMLPLSETGGTVTVGLGFDITGAADIFTLVETGGEVDAGRGVRISGPADILGLVETSGPLLFGIGQILDGAAELLALGEVSGPFTAGLGFDVSGAAEVLALVETGGTVSAVRVVDMTGAADGVALVEAGGAVNTGGGAVITGLPAVLHLIETGGGVQTGKGYAGIGPADRLALVETGGLVTALDPNRPAPPQRTWTAPYENRRFGA